LEEDPWDFRDSVGRGEEDDLCFNDRSGRIEKHENHEKHEKHEKYIVGGQVSME
jgi:hypothetical protein